MFGEPITADALGMSLAVLALLLALNLRGVKSAVRFHSVLTFTFVGVALVIVALMLGFGHPQNALPLFATTNGKPWWQGAWATFAFAAAGLTGFQAIPQTIEERSKDVPLVTIQKVVVVSIGAGGPVLQPGHRRLQRRRALAAVEPRRAGAGRRGPEPAGRALHRHRPASAPRPCRC
ncbi:MAG: amino acid permease [Caulobacteraceae bacterium]